MIATWMLYCSLCAVGLSLAAMLAERALLGGRAPVRGVWIGAVALSLLVPGAAFWFAPVPPAAEVAPTLMSEVVMDPAPAAALPAAPASIESRSAAAPRRDWRAALARLDQPLIVAWITLSLAVAFRFFAGIVALVWMRRGWQRRIVHGIPVFVSERTGPAVVGVVSPGIVLPRWVLALETSQLALMLRHEHEHRRAGDGRLLTVAQLALVAMPWNVALWWQVLRLRLAVELDCDARVLQGADARAYGDLLLEVARPRRGPRLMGATAFAERATQLEKRIRVLARHRVRTSRVARAVATCIALAAVSVAWVAPRPPAPARAEAPQASAGSPVVVPPVVTPPSRVAPAPTTVRASADRATTRTTPAPQPAIDETKRVDLRVAAPIVGDSGAGRAVSGESRALPAPCGPTQQPPQVVDSVFALLFAGIALTPDRLASACAILVQLQAEQAMQDQFAMARIVVNRIKQFNLNANRDTALRALLTNDADRAAFDAHAALAPGARGGGGGGGGGGRVGAGGPPVVIRDVTRDSLAVRMLDSARERVVMRGGGGRGSPGGAVAANVVTLTERFAQSMNDATFNRLFDGITLTADQETRARELIAATQKEAMTPTPAPLPTKLRFNANAGIVLMEPASATALMALVTSDAERATLQSRITSTAVRWGGRGRGRQ